MRATSLLPLLLLVSPLFAEDPVADPAKSPTKPAEAADEASGAVVIVSFKGAARALPDVTRTKEEAKARAEEALKAARAKGSNFYDVVTKYSDDAAGRGCVGVIPKGKCTIPALEAALFGMEIGQVADVIECDLGFMVVTRLAPKTAASHILIMYKGSERAPAEVTRTKEEAKALAEKCHERVTAGKEEFAKVAAEISDCPSKAQGGNLGTFPRGVMAPAFEDAAFALQPGETSGVIETPFGYHVILGMKIEKPVTWGASHILIRWKGTLRADESVTRTKEEAKAEIEALLKRLKDGEDFAKLAGEKSDCPSKVKGGDLGVFGPGAMIPEFEKALAALEVGGMSGVVETEFGFHIIKRTK